MKRDIDRSNQLFNLDLNDRHSWLVMFSSVNEAFDRIAEMMELDEFASWPLVDDDDDGYAEDCAYQEILFMEELVLMEDTCCEECGEYIPNLIARTRCCEGRES